jgi:hypothetical protein
MSNEQRNDSIPGVSLEDFDKETAAGAAPYVVLGPSFGEQLKSDETQQKDSMPFIAPAVGAVAGAIARTSELRQAFNALVSAGVSPEAAVDILAKNVETRPIAQPAGAASAQVIGSGQMTSGDKWAAKIGGPGGETAEQAYENYRLRKKLAEGETLLRSGLVLPPGSSPRGSHPSIRQVIAEENSANRARQIAESRRGAPFGISAPRTQAVANWTARTPGIIGKGFGALGGAAAGYEGYEAYKAFKDAQDAPGYANAVLKALTAAGSGMAATPIPAVQIPGLMLGAGIPAARWLGEQLSGLTSAGASPKAEEAFAPPRRQ